MQLAIGELMGATTEQDAAARVLPPMAEMVGARGIVLEGRDGTVGRRAPRGEDDPNGDVRRWSSLSGRLVVRTSAFAPFFGDEERKLLYALGSLTSLALDRSRLFAQERQAREALSVRTSSRTSSSRSQRTSCARRSARSTGSRRRSPNGALGSRRSSSRSCRDAHEPDQASARARRAAARSFPAGCRCRHDQAAARARARAARADRPCGVAAGSVEDRDRGGCGARGRGGRGRTRADRLEPDRQRVPVRRAARLVRAVMERRCPAGDGARTRGRASRTSSCRSCSTASPATRRVRRPSRAPASASRSHARTRERITARSATARLRREARRSS